MDLEFDMNDIAPVIKQSFWFVNRLNALRPVNNFSVMSGSFLKD